jgi:thioredoxin 1
MESNSLPKSFDDLIARSEKPVLVDFWAEWCGACRMLSPTLLKVASEYKGRIVTVKVNVDKKAQLASRFQVSGIPTVILFAGGNAVMRFSGALAYEQFKQQLDQALAELQSGPGRKPDSV